LNISILILKEESIYYMVGGGDIRNLFYFLHLSSLSAIYVLTCSFLWFILEYLRYIPQFFWSGSENDKNLSRRRALRAENGTRNSHSTKQE
jgi:hypothetical protein